MENNELYYEVNAATSGEVEAAYKYAVAHNIRYYRVKSKSGKIFGWIGDKHVIAEDGQEWFDNPHYKAPVTEEEKDLDISEDTETDAETDVAVETVEQDEAINDIDKAADVDVNSDKDDASSVTEKETTVDPRIAELEHLVKEKSAQLDANDNKLRELKNAIKIIKAFIGEV